MRSLSQLEAIRLLQTDHVIALPTETVYGLAASLSAPKGEEALFDLKKRGREKAIPLLVSSVDEILPFVQCFPPRFLEFAEKYWPGPLTLVIPTPERAGYPTTAFRIPDHPLTLHLLEIVGPLLVTSANLAGHPPPTTAEEVAATFGDRLPIYDGGPCREQIPSTIIAWNDHSWNLLRQGALNLDL